MGGSSARETGNVCLKPGKPAHRLPPSRRLRADFTRPVPPKFMGFALWLLWLCEGISEGKRGSYLII